MTAKPEVLWVAVMFQGRIRTKVVVLRGRTFVWISGNRRLEVICSDSHGCSFAEALLTDKDNLPNEAKRLLFCQNNTVGEFKVRVYRTLITPHQAKEDFARQVEPARYQGQNY